MTPTTSFPALITAPDLGFGRIVVSDNYRCTESVRETGMKWVRGCAKRQCDRALTGPRRHPDGLDALLTATTALPMISPPMSWSERGVRSAQKIFSTTIQPPHSLLKSKDYERSKRRSEKDVRLAQ